MPSRGLSLVGFMYQQPAIHHLRIACVPADPSDAALIAEWTAAQATLGAPITNAGKPDVQQLAPADMPYIAKFMAEPWVAFAFNHPILQASLQGATFRVIEIDPLLAFQSTVFLDRADHHCGRLNNPSIADLLPVCLPIVQPREPLLLSPVMPGSQSVIIKSRNLNVQSTQMGNFEFTTNGYTSYMAGLQYHLSPPFAHVVRYNGRCYLHNGYHRAVGIRMTGATHMPCLFRDVTTPEAVGIRPDGSTFGLPLLESTNPPTLGHLTQGRAHDVQIRAVSRILHVTWAEYVMPDEYERMAP